MRGQDAADGPAGQGEGWRQYACAPPHGTAVAPAASIAGARCLTVTSGKGAFPLLVVRLGDTLVAWVNACPHQYLPLDTRSASVLSADGTRLLCSVHGAAYRADTGEGVAGFGLGATLDRVPIHTDAAGVIRIGPP